MPVAPFAPGYFSLPLCTLMIGPYTITGFGDGDVISFDPVTDVFGHEVGADGKTVVYSENDYRVNVTLIVTAQSGAYNTMGALLQAQQASGIPTPLPFYFVDPSTGTTISDSDFIFTKYPAMKFSKKDGSRTFGGLLPNGLFPTNSTMAPTKIVP